MKKNQYLILLPILLVIIFSCGQPALDVSTSLLLSVKNSLSSRTIMPEVSFDLFSCSIIGSGPNEETISLSIDSDHAIIDDITEGEWSITVSGFNSDGLLIGIGSDEVTIIRGIENIVDIILSPPPGTGNLSYTITWGSIGILEPTVEFRFLNDFEEEIDLFPEYIADGIILSNPVIVSGFYTLQVEIYDMEEKVYGFTDVILIFNGMNSTGEYDIAGFEISHSGTLSLQIQNRHADIIPLSILVNRNPIFAGFDTTYSILSPERENVQEYRWFINGIEQIEYTGELCTYISPETEKTVRIDVVGLPQSDLLNWQRGYGTTQQQVYMPTFYGDLLFLYSLYDSADNANGLSGARSVAVEATSRYIYTAGYDDDGIAVFQFNTNNSNLEFIHCIKDPQVGFLDGINNLFISKNNDLLIATSFRDSAVNVFDIETDPMYPILLDSITAEHLGDIGLSSAFSSVMSADQRFIYTTSTADDSISVIGYDNDTQELNLIQTLSIQENSIMLLLDPKNLCISPDGLELLVCCSGSDSLLVFSVNPDTGRLIFKYALTDGIDGVDGLNAIENICISSSGECVYTCGYYDNAVSLFRRLTETDTFEFAGCWKNNASGVFGLKYPRALCFSQNEQKLYAACSGEDSVAVFERETVDGNLNFLDSLVNLTDRIEGLDGIRDIAIIPDGSFVCAVSSNSNSISLFQNR
jgi:6-phosphogluconolactonase (cycloisomerase 2 family)